MNALSFCSLTHGPRSKFSSGGSKEEGVDEIWGEEGRGGGLGMRGNVYSIECFYLFFLPHLQWRCYRVSKFTITILHYINL